jgi:hypothetical protein
MIAAAGDRFPCPEAPAAGASLLDPVPDIRVAGAVFLPGGGPLAQWIESRMARSILLGGFLEG